MNETNDKHLVEYLILIAGLLVAFVVFYLFRHDPRLQLFTGFCGSLFYALWGIIHHAVEGRLNKSIFAEYIIVGIFIFTLLSVVIIY